MVEYQDFIQNKVRFDHGDGLTCSEADVNPILKFALAGRAGLDIERAVVEKFELNQERAHLGRWA